MSSAVTPAGVGEARRVSRRPAATARCRAVIAAQAAARPDICGRDERGTDVGV
ncbi:hypothetical protein V2I01_42700 [Micromonospora sp. BRA006-A]|nr:hypothetical protein [Micromonospora sp. BRA006-A]